MTGFDTVRLIATREVRERLRSKLFLMSSAFSLLLVLAAAIVPGLVRNDDPTTYDVGVVGSTSSDVANRMETLVAQSGENVKVSRHEVTDVAAAERAVHVGDLDVVIVDGTSLIVKEGIDGRLDSLIQVAHREVTAEAELLRAGVAAGAATAALRPAPLTVRSTDPPDEQRDARDALMFAGTMLLYGQLLGYGYWVASGIVEEKSSRVIEVVLAKARSAHVLAGKVIGIGVLGFLQLVAFVVIGLVAASVSGSVDLPPQTARIAVEVVAWFVLGYAFYACLFAAAGALASRAEELQSTTGPISMVIIMAFFAAMFSGDDPGGTVARVATFLPPSAPLVLPLRSAAGELALWEALASIALVLLATYGAVRFAARVYAGSALNVRGQLKLREALNRAR
ncbi:MAG: ABC transporter permease [Mycobacteriales bacterium]